MERRQRIGPESNLSNLEHMLALLERATTAQDVGRLFTTAARNEGYENCVLARVLDGVLVDAAWISMPDGFVETYLDQGWALVDPILSEALRSRVPFTWGDVMAKRHLTVCQLAMMADAERLGVHSGLTIPVHGPDGQCDMVSLSLRHKHATVDPARRTWISLFAVQCVTRLAELERQERVGSQLGRLSDAPPGTLGSFVIKRRNTTSGKSEMPFVLEREHLRALVLIEVSVRRWQMGLTELGGRIYERRSSHEVADLEQWGLVVDQPDDMRWRYYLAPSVLGWAYLRGVREVPLLRRDIWATEIDRREVPDDDLLD